MNKITVILLIVFAAFGCTGKNPAVDRGPGNHERGVEDVMVNFQTDTFQLENGTLSISFIGHGTLLMNYNGKIIHIDPVSMYADYSAMPAADVILVTHSHPDHLDSNAIEKIRKISTVVILDGESSRRIQDGIVMKNGDIREIDGITIEAVPAYNTTAGRSNYHPKGRDNGYILSLGGKRVYIAGDTENTPEMQKLENIDIAFLPMNQPYTMTPGQVAEAVSAFKPGIVYPYHYGKTDTSLLTGMLARQDHTEIRIRDLQ
ncbi:MAG: MBL fold metallo-hydrolase [Spirochaetales bacterium]|nr:MBL fold metallo-hydrolase [Spirochaetales bacterium]